MDETGRFADQMPQTIGRYQVQESIGFGAMGAVYKAFDPLIKRTLAIKTLRLDIPRNSPQYKSFIDRFYHEARISGTLSHPNIVTLFDIGEEAGVPYLAMEFVEGETLASILERGVRFKPEKVINLVSQIAAAVDYAHSKGVIHRDIKPSNLILYDDDRVKVTDFGIAKLADAEMTQSGTLLGTPAYMSPEQAMGEKLDGRSDIFSLGVCAFEMLSGEQPFAGPNVTAILYKLVHVEPVEPANLEMNGLVPQKWHEVFGKVLAKRPDDRYQTATEFVQDLEYCLGSWFGSAMLDTLVDQDPGGAIRTAVEAAMGSAARPETPAPVAAASASAPPFGQADEVTTALPRPAGLAAPAASLPDEDDVPATVLMSAPIPTPSDTDTMPLASPPPIEEPEVEGTLLIHTAGSARPSAAPPPGSDGEEGGPTVRMVSPAAKPATGAVKKPGASMAPPSVPEFTVPLPALSGVSSAAARPAVAPLPPAEEVPPTVLMSAAAVRPPATATPASPPRGEPRPSRRAPGGPAAGPVTEAVTPPVAPAAVPAAPGKGARMLLLAGAGLLLVLFAVAAAGLLLIRRAGTSAAASPLPVTVPPPPPPTAAAAPTPEPTPGVLAISGMLHVESQPGGASVTVDGQPRGTTPLDVSELPLGAHEVRLELQGFASSTQKVILTAETPQVDLRLTLSRSAPPTGMAEVHSTPAGALVRIDGVAVGQTPLRQYKLKAGSHAVELIKDGYEPWAGSLAVPAGRPAHLEAQLRPLPRATPTPDAVDLSRIYLPTEVETVPRRVSGTTAAYPDRAPRLRPGKDVTVVCTFVVTETGEVTDPSVTESGGPIVDAAVLAAVRNWKYAPGVKKGVKVKVRMSIKQTFRVG